MWSDALPRNGITNWKTYYAVQSTDTAVGWQTWVKPAGCAWIYIFMIAAGGGGGRSNDSAVTVAAGGGASGGHTRLLIPAFVVPDVLYIRPGTGGLGATVAGSGATGVTSYVAMQPNTTIANGLISQAAGQGGGGAATNTAGPNGGIGISAQAIQCLGLFTTVNGTAGGAGAASSNSAGTSVTQTNGIVTTPGAGGGNGTGAGGDIINAVVFPTISGGAGTTGVSGRNGFQLGAMWTPGLKSFPMIWSGGSGGGGNNSGGTCGNGGNAAYGGGGGGGGANGGAAGTAGNGGKGGDGIIFIGAF